MDSREFGNMIPIVFKELESNNFDTSLVNKYNAFRTYMYTHPDDEIVMNFKKELLTKYKNKFLDPALNIALNMNDSLSNFKRQQIYRYLPFILDNRNYFNLLYRLYY